MSDRSLLSYSMMLLVAAGFAISVALVNITKWLYVSYNFKYALWITGSHMVASYLAASFGLFVLRLVPNRPVLSIYEQC